MFKRIWQFCWVNIHRVFKGKREVGKVFKPCVQVYFHWFFIFLADLVVG